ASIRTFGFLIPVLIDEADMVLAGHGRIAAARLVGLETVPVIRVTHLTSAHKRALVIVDNRLAELAGWDNSLLKVELAEIAALDLAFDMEIAGSDPVEIDRLQQECPESPDLADKIPPMDDRAPPVSRLGDVWEMGRHRVICGDALKQETYLRLMGGT